MYGYEEQGNDERPESRVAIAATAVVALAALGWFVVRPALDDEPQTVVPIDESALTATPSSVPAITSPEPSSTPTATTVAPTTLPATTTEATTDKTTTTDASRPLRPNRSTTTTDVPRRTTTTTTAPRRTTTTTTSTTRPPQSYSTLPDGSPEPVLVVFDVDTITLTGAVPSEADKRRAADLAIANSKFPDAKVQNKLTINSSVPRNVGARVVELTSTRFPEASAEIRPAHAAELDRVATVMDALPRVTALVVGHADQRGDETENFALSEERAQAVVTYLVGQGIAPSRLSSRAVGETDLLAIGDDAATLALNRRTEFILYGLLLE